MGAADRGSLMIAYLSVFIDMLGLSLIIPIIPFLALRFGADSTALGYIYASYNGAQMVSVPVTGWLSDRYGRKPLILASLFGSFGGFLIQGLATDLVTFCIGRVVTGIFGGSVPIVNAYIVDTVPTDLRPKYFAQLGAVIIVAFMFGPGIGAGLAQFTLQTPMLVASGVAGVGFLIALFAFKEPEKEGSKPKTAKTDVKENDLPAESKQHIGDVESSNLGTTRTSKHDEEEVSKPEYGPPIYIMYVISLIYALAFSGYIYYIGLLMFDLWGWGALEYGFVAMAASVFVVINQMTSFVYFQKAYGKHASLVFGSTFMGAGMLGISFLGTCVRCFSGLPLMAISLALLSVGVSFAQPAITSITSRYASKSEQGSVLGRSQALRALGQTLGPLIWGGVYGVQWQLVYVLCMALCLVIAALAIAVLYLNRRLPEHTDPKPKSVMEMTSMRIKEENASPEEVQALKQENLRLRQKLRKVIEDEEKMMDPDVMDTLQTGADPANAAQY